MLGHLCDLDADDIEDFVAIHAVDAIFNAMRRAIGRVESQESVQQNPTYFLFISRQSSTRTDHDT